LQGILDWPSSVPSVCSILHFAPSSLFSQSGHLRQTLLHCISTSFYASCLLHSGAFV